MRCLKCRLDLYEAETICPSCGTAAPIAVSKAASVRHQQRLLAENTTAFGSLLASVPGLKWVVGLLLFLIGGAVILVALGCFFTYQSEGERGPPEVTADKLRDLSSLDSLPDPWISYTFPSSCETSLRFRNVSLTRNEAYSRFILVQVKDRWLAVQVPPNFAGDKLVGQVEQLGHWDGATLEKDLSSQIKNQIVASHPDKAHLILPYQVNAVAPYQSKIYGGYFLAVGIALIGVMVGCGGFRIVRAKPRLA